MANANAIPLNADKIVFAFDVFDHFMKKANPQMRGSLYTSSIAHTVESYRVHTSVRFNDRLKRACDVLNETQKVIVRKDFEEIMGNNKTVSKECLTGYDDRFRDSCFEEGFDYGKFLVYCTRIAAISCSFYGHGLREAADTAVQLIVSVMPEHVNWANFNDLNTERRVSTEESSPSMNQNYLRREPPKLISSETGECSNDSITICESDSILTDNFNESEGSSETESTFSVPYMEVQDVTAEISKLTVSNFDQTCDITEQSGLSSLSSPVPYVAVQDLPAGISKLTVSNFDQICDISEQSGISSLSPVPLPASNLLEVPITRSSSVSPRKRSFPKEDTIHLQPRNLSDELAEPTSSLGKRRSTGKDDSVSSNIPESAAEKDETAEEVFAPTESKKPKIEDDDKK